MTAGHRRDYCPSPLVYQRFYKDAEKRKNFGEAVGSIRVMWLMDQDGYIQIIDRLKDVIKNRRVNGLIARPGKTPSVS